MWPNRQRTVKRRGSLRTSCGPWREDYAVCGSGRVLNPIRHSSCASPSISMRNSKRPAGGAGSVQHSMPRPRAHWTYDYALADLTTRAGFAGALRGHTSPTHKPNIGANGGGWLRYMGFVGSCVVLCAVYGRSNKVGCSCRACCGHRCEPVVSGVTACPMSDARRTPWRRAGSPREPGGSIPNDPAQPGESPSERKVVHTHGGAGREYKLSAAVNQARSVGRSFLSLPRPGQFELRRGTF